MGSGKGRNKRVQKTVRGSAESSSYAVSPDWDEVTEWRADGVLHRVGGPAIEHLDGSSFWYINGELHRDGGPAVVAADVREEWFQRGRRHRVDGPAIEWVAGWREWWVDGKQLSEEEFEAVRFTRRLSGIKMETPDKVIF